MKTASLERLISRAKSDAREAFASDLRYGIPEPMKIACFQRIVSAMQVEGFDAQTDCEETVSAACEYASAFRNTYSEIYHTQYAP